MGKKWRLTELEAQMALTALLARCGRLAEIFIFASWDIGLTTGLEAQVACFQEARETLDQAEALVYAILLRTGDSWETAKNLKPESRYVTPVSWYNGNEQVSRQAVHKRLKELSDEVFAKAQREVYSDTFVRFLPDEVRAKMPNLLMTRLIDWELPKE